MKRNVFILLFAILVVPLNSYAEEGQEFHLKCRPGDERQFISTTVLKSGDDVRRVDAETKRRLVLSVDSIVVRENSVVMFGGSSRPTIKRLKRGYALGKDCSVSDALDFDDIVRLGPPTIYPESAVQVGSTWRSGFNIRYQGSEVPVVASYTLEKTGRLADRNVAVVSLIMSGFGVGLKEDSRLRWAGIGREVWDLSDGTPLIRSFEMKRGASFVKDVDLELSYSESALY